jgi:hypothetical protein
LAINGVNLIQVKKFSEFAGINAIIFNRIFADPRQ